MIDTTSPIRVGIVADMLEEHWPSMDLVADMLVEQLGRGACGDIEPTPLRPPILRRLTRVPGLKVRAKADTADRVMNRFWDYPRWLSGIRDNFDLFHIVDHTYAHLVKVLPAARTVVTCHDADAFLSIVDPALTTTTLPNVFARRILSGMRQARYVTCDSVATYDDIRRYDLIPADRLRVVLNGTDAIYSARPVDADDAAIDGLLGERRAGVDDLLHVGTTIPRKRIDLLLSIVAAVRQVRPGVRLVKAGGTFTGDQRDLVRRLGLESHIVELPFLSRGVLAALYRRTAVVLVTSDREGFGLPLAEAMACGTPVIATDLPVLREVGGAAAVYATLADIDGWRDCIVRVLNERTDPEPAAARRRACLEQASHFKWDRYAMEMAAIYRQLATVTRPVAAALSTADTSAVYP